MTQANLQKKGRVPVLAGGEQQRPKTESLKKIKNKNCTGLSILSFFLFFGGGGVGGAK